MHRLVHERKQLRMSTTHEQKRDDVGDGVVQRECCPNDADRLHVDRSNRYCVTKIWNVSQLGAPLRSWVSVSKNLVIAIDRRKD